MTEQVENKEVPTAPDASKAEANELTINDLNAMKVIIDIASSRGAFKPNEMVAVGQTYAKLTTFLDSVSKQAEGAKQYYDALEAGNKALEESYVTKTGNINKQVIDARNANFPSIFGALRPCIPFSKIKPRITPSSLAHTTNTWAMGEFVIHILLPFSK